MNDNSYMQQCDDAALGRMLADLMATGLSFSDAAKSLENERQRTTLRTTNKIDTEKTTYLIDTKAGEWIV